MAVSLTSFLGTDVLSQLHGGYQSLVYEAVDADGNRCIGKLRDSQGDERETLVTKMLMVADLAGVDSRVCAPLAIDGSYVVDVDVEGSTMLGTLFEFADGDVLDATKTSDVELMGAQLNTLHTSLSALPTYDLPLVPALTAVGYEPGSQQMQLLHGDFNTENLRKGESSVRIFDFDECGYGPREFDVANSLYMVLFDSYINGHHGDYLKFKQAFVDGYMAQSTEEAFDVDALPSSLDLRVNALAQWLSDPHSSPPGVRNAGTQWRAKLGQFVDHYRSQTG